MAKSGVVEWVQSAIDIREKQRRQAVHIVLYAIASSEELNSNMLMKGGMLIAIRYRSSRYTKDLDFSTSLDPSKFDQEAFKRKIEDQLALASENFDYGIACRVQRFRKEPNKPEATFPTFQITIGYAYKHEKNNLRQLLQGRSSTALRIDYSFNEQIQDTEKLEISKGRAISVYSYTDLVAEKYRAILQQKVRNKAGRRQDVYDLYYLFKKFPKPNKQDKQAILKSLIIKSESREVPVSVDALSDEVVIEKSRKNFDELKNEIYEELPTFENAYQEIKKVYESLPWKRS